ncbi:MAG: kynureninase [Myxococcaceae bacterium]|nr:kynureninase [Myxococcaceae bacterium]MCI0668944.1 kynureninase [Myxococcaceae bacterium]
MTTVHTPAEAYRDDAAWARAQDASDPLARFRGEFLFPRAKDGQDALYFAGHSLGLQPRNVRPYIAQELDDWERLGVEGHFEARHPWMPYHELLTDMTARLVGAKPVEVAVMNTLTVNVHLMMVSFYRPTPQRFRILIEGTAFPSDRYAVASQARFHGYDPKDAVLTLEPRPGEFAVRDEDVLSLLEREGDSVALVLLGQPNYLTGQAFDAPAIVRAGHRKGCVVGFDLAHGAGNLKLSLHEWGPDFAAWCNYKYLNAGPGGLGGVFVHERHARAFDLPRFAGWWGHDKETRFKMGPDFQPIPGAEGWQLSNPPIFQLAALRASMELFDAAGMDALSAKSAHLTGYLEWLLGQLPAGWVEQLTPREPHRRGTMLTLRVPHQAKALVDSLQERGAFVDLRNPDIVRIAPVPLYTRYADVHRLVSLLREFFETHGNP